MIFGSAAALIQGDCLEVMRKLPENSVDALVTDPPAGISFMSKAWDDDKGGRKQWIAWLESVMREALRVMKPGAHGLVWALPRTSHWTGAALEDAGFEVRDCITHLFGSGFPKSLNISMAIDKAAGAERARVAPNPNHRTLTVTHSMCGEPHTGDGMLTASATDAAKQWDGWGTALKPAAEFWFLVRKPLSEKTVAANVLKWGTGGLNIDASRVEAQDLAALQKNWDRIQSKGANGSNAMGPGHKQIDLSDRKPSGRYPANLLLSCECADAIQHDLDCAVAELDRQSGTLKSGARQAGVRQGRLGGLTHGDEAGDGGPALVESQGGASRFFYCAKVGASERNAGLDGMPDQIKAMSGGAAAAAARGETEYHSNTASGFDRIQVLKNHHPTVKPQKLMRYLIRLITAPGGIVLDPFMGSGSTGLAAVSEGFRFIGIEKEGEYQKIAVARLAYGTR